MYNTNTGMGGSEYSLCTILTPAWVGPNIRDLKFHAISDHQRDIRRMITHGGKLYFRSRKFGPTHMSVLYTSCYIHRRLHDSGPSIHQSDLKIMSDKLISINTRTQKIII